MGVVRVAGPADREEIWRLFIDGYTEVGMTKTHPYNRDRVDWWLTRMLHPDLLDPLDTGPRGVIGVIGKPERLEALAFLTIGGFWYSDHKHLEEFLVYVDKNHRSGELSRQDVAKNGTTHLRALVDWMKEQSTLTGLPLLTGILSLQPRTEAKVRLYERMLPKAGAFFCFDPITRGSSGLMSLN